jgi:sugar lactone lactonase YvrE
MEELSISQFEEIIKGQLDSLISVSEDFDGSLFLCTSDGSIYTLSPSGLSKKTETGGQPFSIIHDSSNTLFIADLAQQAIFSYSDEDSIQELIKLNEGEPFLGPNSLAFHENSNSLYFTDSGPMGETSLTSPKGSVYVADVEQGTIKPVIRKCLAHPAGIVIAQDGKLLFVAETYRNRVLKICVTASGEFHTTVFHQFSGRLGPTAMCIGENGLLYVANFDFETDFEH